MAQITVHLVCDRQTGRKTVRVSLVADADALPWEEEQLHRAVLQNLFGTEIWERAAGERLAVGREASPEVAGEPPRPAGDSAAGSAARPIDV